MIIIVKAMEPSELKHEFDKDAISQCPTCLSLGRKVWPLQRLADIYKINFYHYLSQFQGYEWLQVCWECYSLVKKILKFHEQVTRANELLHTNQSSIIGSLSHLVSVTINETHETIYIDANDLSNKTNIDKNKDANSFEDLNETQLRNGEINLNNATNDKINVNKYQNPIENIGKECASVIEDHSDVDKLSDLPVANNAKNRLKSRWALRKAEENRTPKFKVLKDSNEAFMKVHITHEELKECIETDKQSDYYMSKRFKCEDCVLSFNRRHNLLKHNEIYHCDEYCDTCNEKVDNSHLLRHISKHCYVYRCVVCLTVCRTRGMGLWHFEREHKRAFQCLKCKLQFRSRREFYVHHKNWHEKFTCDKCGISFKMKYCLENHIRKQHSPYECKSCNKKFARHNGLWLHNKLVHRPASPAYCVECDKQYKDVYRLKWHLCNSVTHTPRDKLRIPCPSCGKIFTKNIYMKDHYNLVHLKVYKYRCDDCDKNFIRNADLVKHKRKVHDGILPPKNKICSVCKRGFTTNKILSNHLRTHTGERPFGCGACTARFAQLAALRAHVRARHANQ